MNRNSEEKAFAKYTPSAFIVASPFQLICAIEAIHEFEIEKYRIAFILERNSSRNQQMYAMAENYQIEYDVYWMGENLDDFDEKRGDFADRAKKEYDRIFIGDYFPAMYNKYASIYAKNGATMLYMDDGNSTILFFKDIYKYPKPDNWRKQLNWYRSTYRWKHKTIQELENRGVYDTNCFFTIYTDIQTRRFTAYPNRLEYVKSISKPVHGNYKDAVLIVGTVSNLYAETERIEISLLEAIHWQKLSEVRKNHPQCEIIFIPHNRDVNQNINQFCSMLNIEYRRLDEPIETYLLKSDLNPVAVYGFGSSALVPIRRMYPEAKVVTWTLQHYDQHRQNIIDRTINNYYKKAGIKEELIWLPKGMRIKKGDDSLKGNLQSILYLLLDKITGKKHG